MVASENRIVSAEEGIVYLTPEEARAEFDRAAHHIAGISGDEFLRRWDADEYEDLRRQDPIQHGRLRRLAEVRGFAR